MNEFLTVGDAFELKDGMKVYASIPEKFTHFNRKMSNEITQSIITIGEIRTNEFNLSDSSSTLQTEIQKLINLELGLKANEDQLNEFVNTLFCSYTKETLDTNIYKGEYVVIKVNDNYDFFSSASKEVFCKKLKNGLYDPDGIEIMFHQDGQSYALILPKDITLTKRYEMSFQLK